MSDISRSSLGESLDAEFEKKIAGADFETIKTLMAERAVSKGLVVRDAYDSSVLIPTERATPQRFAKTVEVAGKKLIFEGDSELEVERNVGDYFRSLHPSPAAETQTEVQRDERGRFVSRVDDPVAKAELDLRFKRGEIDAATYLAESGAVDAYLHSQGVSLDDLKEASTQRFTVNWEQATNDFLARHPDWQGGDANLQEVGRTLQTLHLENSPSVEALEAAYADMQRRNAVAENPELRAQQEIHSKFADARSFSEIKDASSLFGRR